MLPEGPPGIILGTYGTYAGGHRDDGDYTQLLPSLLGTTGEGQGDLLETCLKTVKSP